MPDAPGKKYMSGAPVILVMLPPSSGGESGGGVVTMVLSLVTGDLAPLEMVTRLTTLVLTGTVLT